MDSSFNRRDFLRLAGATPLSLALPRLLRPAGRLQAASGTQQSVLIIVFDALSARHIPFHGYGRETTPNLRRLAERAIVYHNHYAASDYTTPGTTSLLSGTLPWTHRALERDGTAAPSFASRTIFNAFSGYHSVAYSHNTLVNTLFNQFEADLDEYVLQGRLLRVSSPFTDRLFRHDKDTADIAWTRAMKKLLPTEEEGSAYSLLASELYSRFLRRMYTDLAPAFPVVVPNVGGDIFLLEDAIDWLGARVPVLPGPYVGYFHMLPPHAPYGPPEEFHRYFARDGLSVPNKPVHPLRTRIWDDTDVWRARREYDEYVLYVDREFGRLFSQLDASGILDTTWLVLTADHGELFERGYAGHWGPLMYEGALRIPLLIFEPGRTSRLDVHAPTSAIDVLPTLLHVTGQDPAPWTEGTILPPFAPPPDDRSIFALYADQPSELPIGPGTAVIVRNGRKLIHTFGYPELGGGGERVELYDLGEDPEELVDLSASRRDIADEMFNQLSLRLGEADGPYRL